jgi:hypothetical protein
MSVIANLLKEYAQISADAEDNTRKIFNEQLALVKEEDEAEEEKEVLNDSPDDLDIEEIEDEDGGEKEGERDDEPLDLNSMDDDEKIEIELPADYEDEDGEEMPLDLANLPDETPVEIETDFPDHGVEGLDDYRKEGSPDVYDLVNADPEEVQRILGALMNNPDIKPGDVKVIEVSPTSPKFDVTVKDKKSSESIGGLETEFEGDEGLPLAEARKGFLDSERKKSVTYERKLKEMQNALRLESQKRKKADAENAQYKEALKEAKRHLDAISLTNTKLGHVCKLLTEHATTAVEKREVIKAFEGDEIKTIRESKMQYDMFKRLFEKKANVGIPKQAEVLKKPVVEQKANIKENVEKNGGNPLQAAFTEMVNHSI